MLNRHGEKVSDIGGIDVYEKYGIKMPLHAKYIRQPNRIYFDTDPKHDEVMSFYCSTEKPSSNASGLAFYWGEGAYSHLVSVYNLEPIE